jgi:plasmid stability protein
MPLPVTAHDEVLKRIKELDQDESRARHQAAYHRRMAEEEERNVLKAAAKRRQYESMLKGAQ